MNLILAAQASLFLGLCGCGNAPTEADADAAAVREAVLMIDEHIRHRDLEGLRSDHLDSPKFTKFGPRVMRRQGFDAMIADEIAAVSAAEGLSIDFRELKVDIFGDIAIATSYPLFSSRGPDGEPVTREARMTLVFVRTAAGWKIVHEHSSPYVN